MTVQQQLALAELSEWLVLLAPALIVLFIRFRYVLISGALGVALAWIAVNAIRYYVTIPLREAVWAVQDSAPDNDSDIAGNVALLFLGWVFPLLSVLVVLLLRYFWRRFHRPSYASNVV
jgi:hypothetical protein